jgi:glycerol uptake facilitator-like aquaporin
MLDYLAYFLTTLIGAFIGSFLANYWYDRHRGASLDINLPVLDIRVRHSDDLPDVTPILRTKKL